MDFTLYDISEIDIDEINTISINHLLTQKNNFDWVEQGLSGGEARQSLLDRFKEDLRKGELHSINITLSSYDMYIDNDILENEKKIQDTIFEIDELLYELDNDELNEKIWCFSEEVIFLVLE